MEESCWSLQMRGEVWVELDSKPKNKNQKQTIELSEVSTGGGAVNIHLRAYKDFILPSSVLLSRG